MINGGLGMCKEIVKEYRIDKRKFIVSLVLFLMVVTPIMGIMTCNVRTHYEVLNGYDEVVKNASMGLEQFDSTKILDIFRYQQDERKARFALLILSVVGFIALIILNSYFFTNVKMRIDEKGIQVYSIYKKKPSYIFLWKNIKSITLGYAGTMRSVIPEYGIKICYMKMCGDKITEVNGFIPINKFESDEEIIYDIKKFGQLYDLEKDYLRKRKHVNTLKVVKEGYKEFRLNFIFYIYYSAIIFVFAILSKVIKESPMTLIFVFVNIYITFRARISMNYRAYLSYLGKQIDIDEAWAYSKSKFWRFLGADLLLSCLFFLFVGFEYIIITKLNNLSFKILCGSIIAIVGFFTIVRFFLIDYIASITEEKEAYLEINNKIIKGNYWSLVRIIGVWTIGIIPAIIMFIVNWKDADYIRELTKKMSYIYIFVNLFIIPILNCVMIKFIVGAGFKKGDRVENE